MTSRESPNNGIVVLQSFVAPFLIAAPRKHRNRYWSIHQQLGTKTALHFDDGRVEEEEIDRLSGQVISLARRSNYVSQFRNLI
jgi:hypothetical protein